MLVRILKSLSLCALLVSLIACNGTGPSDGAIQKLGVLRVAIEKNAHVYFTDNRAMGFELDLIKAYADTLGVELDATYVSSNEEVKALLRERRVHVGLGMQPVIAAQEQYSFGPSIATTSIIVVTHTDAPKISSTADLESLTTVTNVEDARKSFDDISPTVLANLGATTLLNLVEQDAFDAAIITDADFLVLKRKFPYLQKRLTLRRAVPLAWMMAKPTSPELQRSIGRFISEKYNAGYLSKRWEFHYDHLEGFDFVDARKFLRRYKSELPKYRAEFQQAAAEHGFDWRLLAALSYQESHWNPTAKSPTGVKGLMMLTRKTAKELGVSRLDPTESIHGGTRYLATLQARLEDEITAEEQPLMALAAYNVGFGHLRDAQRVARNMNKNSSEWRIVKAHLPLLNKEKYAKQTRYGRARGGQAVHYVEGVRRYFSMIRLMEPEDWVVAAPPSTPKYTMSDLGALF